MSMLVIYHLKQLRSSRYRRSAARCPSKKKLQPNDVMLRSVEG
jgi:hypothetical protein